MSRQDTLSRASMRTFADAPVDDRENTPPPEPQARLQPSPSMPSAAPAFPAPASINSTPPFYTPTGSVTPTFPEPADGAYWCVEPEEDESEPVGDLPNPHGADPQRAPQRRATAPPVHVNDNAHDTPERRQTMPAPHTPAEPPGDPRAPEPAMPMLMPQPEPTSPSFPVPGGAEPPAPAMPGADLDASYARAILAAFDAEPAGEMPMMPVPAARVAIPVPVHRDSAVAPGAGMGMPSPSTPALALGMPSPSTPGPAQAQADAELEQLREDLLSQANEITVLRARLASQPPPPPASAAPGSEPAKPSTGPSPEQEAELRRQAEEIERLQAELGKASTAKPQPAVPAAFGQSAAELDRARREMRAQADELKRLKTQLGAAQSRADEQAAAAAAATAAAASKTSTASPAPVKPPGPSPAELKAKEDLRRHADEISQLRAQLAAKDKAAAKAAQDSATAVKAAAAKAEKEKKAAKAPERPPIRGEGSHLGTEYTHMLLALDAVPFLHNAAAAAATWVLLAGFVVLPGTFSTLSNISAREGSVEASVIQAVQNIPLFVIAYVLCGIGAAGMIWLWWRYSRNYIWLLSKIFVPGALNGLAGVASTLASVLGAQDGRFNASAKTTIAVTGGTSVICGVLALWYTYVMLGRVKRAHERAVGKEVAGRHGEGMLKAMKEVVNARTTTVA